MRNDMKKVLTERPRFGSSSGYHSVRRKANRGDNDNLPSYQGMRRPYLGGWGDDQKEFNDHVQPLKRYLYGCVGRSWNDVWSEICKAVPSGNTVDAHLKDHVLREIDINTYINEDGELRVRSRYSYGFQNPPRGLYVDCRDGLIYYGEETKRPHKTYRSDVVHYQSGTYFKDENGVLWPSKWYNTGKYPVKELDGLDAFRIDGIWYRVTYDQVPLPRVIEYIEDGEKKTKRIPYDRYDVIKRYNVHSGVYHATKQQMSSHDLRKYGLVNDPQQNS